MAIALSGSSDGNNIAGPSSQILSENKKGSGGEMVGGCSVCCDDQGTERNLLVYCDGCEVAVHQACYGIISVPSGNWFCRKCESGDSQNKIKCELCPSKDGALKKTETGAWAHVVCALYIPEVRFGNNNTMEPIEIKHIQADRYNQSCYLCEEGGDSTTASYGAVMNCHKSGCKQAFHVTCAQSAGLLCEEGGQGSEHVNYCGYCKHHFRKLKAGSRKAGGNYLNNSNSSYADSASDSSQDNDSRCNKTEQDKSSSNRTTNKLPILPTNLSMNDTLAINSNSTLVPSTLTTSKTSSSSNNAPISLTIPINSMSGLSSKTSSSSSGSATTTPQKKKRAPKSAQPNSTGSAATNNLSLPSTLLATAGSLQNSLPAQPTTAPPVVSTNQLETSASQANICKWSGKDAPINNKSSSNTKKKSATTLNTQSSTLPSSAKPPLTSTTQTMSMTNYNTQKISSPNLSLSTSPSLSSPSNSTKSTSNSSTSSTANASSSSSSSSNSPSPALLSPNISSNRGSTVAATRLESPLASNSKTGNNLHNRIPTESIPSNTLPIGQNSLQARISLGSSAKSDQKKNPATNSSLLSTAVPHEQPAANTAPSFLPTNGNQVATTDITPATTLANFANLSKGSIVGSARDSPTNFTGPSGTTVNSDTQPIVPPLIIPIPTASNSPTTKSAGRAKPAAKTTRKKSAEISESPKPEPKTKTTRAKKAAAVVVATSTNNNGTSAPKPDNKRGKAKAPSKSAVPATVEPLEGPATKSTSSPNKRKSRSASNETVSTPSPVKRPRKKKAAPNSTQLSDQQASSWNPPPHTNQLGTPGATSATLGAGPLMINTPMVNNRLLQGLSSAEAHADTGSRYFSPMASPYASFDHMNASSLSRASLSRLFTSSSADSNQAFPSDDPGKAFEELRENTWSHLSRCVLEQAAQFDIPSLIGTLYTLRSENEKLVNKVRDLTMRRDQMIATNARLDLSGPMLTQHLNNTSPNFSSVASGLANSPKSLPTISPGSAINKQPLVSIGSYNHVQPGSLGPPSYLDRSSPLVSQTHSGINNIKSSALSTPSPPIGALMAHSTSNRAGLITVNPPYMPNVFPQINSMAQLGTSPQGSSYYPRQ